MRRKKTIDEAIRVECKRLGTIYISERNKTHGYRSRGNARAFKRCMLHVKNRLKQLCRVLKLNRHVFRDVLNNSRANITAIADIVE